MPFWSKSKDEGEAQHSTAQKDFTSDEDAFNSSSMPMSGASSGNSAGEMQQFAMAIQQQVLVQQVISDLTDISFEKCVTGKPSDSLGGREVACVHASTMKWMDTSEFMMGRMAKKQQSSQQQQGQF